MLGLAGGSTDRELLGSYLEGGDPSAFRDLVSRHGSAVHRICMGVLRDAHEAEDAFQATFLLLARKAPVIRDPDALGGWLRGVAYRVSIRARRRATRRRAIEGVGSDATGAEPIAMPSEPGGELREIVGDELGRLPEDYRRPIVLCYLEGLTHHEAARRLDWPVGTVKVRLVRGRRMLRDRLNRRGVSLGAALLVLLPNARRAGAATAPLEEAAVRTMTLAAAGRRARSKLGREFPRAVALADAVRLPGRPWMSPGFWAAVALAAALLVFSTPIARALAGPPGPDVDPSTLPANLADVLNVECR